MKVSDSLVLDARLMGEATHRSIAGQIEFWARLGRALETILRGDQVLALCKTGNSQSLSACFEAMDSSAGRKRLETHLQSLPFPHYEPAPRKAGLLVRIDADGKRTTGRFVNRKFQPVKSARE